MPIDPDFDDAVLGLGLPAEAEQALAQAGALRADPPEAMAALMRAKAIAPEHPAVLIAFYRHHFYGHRLAAARDVARKALVIGARALGLPLVWREVPERALVGAHEDITTRFYLWVLKGYAYLSMRLDDPVEARDALAKLRMLDPDDRVGGALLEAVRQRRERSELRARLRDTLGVDINVDRVNEVDGFDDGEDDGPALPVFGAAAWARVSGSTGAP